MSTRDDWSEWLKQFTGTGSRQDHTPSAEEKSAPNTRKANNIGEDRPLGRFLRTQPKLARNLVLLGLLGLFLLFWGERQDQKPVMQEIPPPAATEALSPGTSTVSEQAAETIQRQLTASLSAMSGVGNVTVYVTLEQGPEQIIAVTEELEERRTTDAENRPSVEIRSSRRPVTIRDDQQKLELPLIVAEKQARVRGVLVIADGADDPSIRWLITDAVTTVLDVPPHRVSVQPKRRS